MKVHLIKVDYGFLKNDFTKIGVVDWDPAVIPNVGDGIRKENLWQVVERVFVYTKDEPYVRLFLKLVSKNKE